MNIPGLLPQGRTVADLPDAEIRQRAEWMAVVFEKLTAEVQSLVSDRTPEKEAELRTFIADTLRYVDLAFRGAREWREAGEPALKEAIAKGALDGKPDDVPPLVLAAFSCDLAFMAEDLFWTTARELGLSPLS